MPPRRPDLKQVAKLFNDTLAAMRDEAPDIDTLEPQAIAWLKNARYKLMRDLEQEFYTLESGRDTPSSWPPWAVNPSQSLNLFMNPLPAVLEPFQQAINNNLLELVKDCGFEHCDLQWAGIIRIRFPAQVRAPPREVRPLVVHDEFSSAQGGQARIGATNFAGLILDARGEGSEAPSTSRKRRIPKDEGADDADTPSVSEKRRSRTNRTAVKKEESEDEGRRLRSVTRASSTVTLRESRGSVRRSSRKSVKAEE
ncbi:hypothetical protein C8R46DRAFT_582153 [Mycena filopes]|nr:hypothetical protein C8R46DRAFT_582153 [Mycena filopes]